jgi:hypothetical protein
MEAREAINIMQHIMRSIRFDENQDIHYSVTDVNYVTALRDIYTVMKYVDQEIFPDAIEGAPFVLVQKMEEDD